MSDDVEMKELPDGRVLVNVSFQMRLVLFDATLANAKVVLDTLNSGASHYPNGFVPLIPFLGDSMLFPDVTARSLTVVDPSARFGRSIAPPSGRDFTRIAQHTVGGKTGTDAQGRLVYQVTAPFARVKLNADGSPGDSLPPPLYAAAIVRANFATRSVDTIARILNLGARRYTDLGLPTMSTVINPLLPAIDDWAVLSDGSIAIVRGHDYHVDWVYPDGTKASTPPLPFDWRRVTDDDKRAKLDSARRIIDSLRAANADPYQSVVFYATKRDTIHPRLDYVTPDQMTDYLPPIRAGAVKPDADGNVWILPTTSAQAKGGLLYDVVNKKGELFQRVQLPAGRVVVGFGRGGVVYMAARAEDGRWYLERARVGS